MSCEAILRDHSALSQRRETSGHQLKKVEAAFANCDYIQGLAVSVFCAGSLAREEIGRTSDLDIFVTADRVAALESRLTEYSLFGHIIRINEELGLPRLSNDGEYLKIYFLDELKDKTGSRRDDSENLFTARMLLMLESHPIVHPQYYDAHLRAILENYFRDQTGKRSFKPLFLLNDILRYWRTLCLNYEERRLEPTRPWRKKNVNLKFSRMVTVFSTVLPLVAYPLGKVDDLEGICRVPPLVRLSRALDHLKDATLEQKWLGFLDAYEEFLGWKEDEDVEKYLTGGDRKEAVRERALQVSEFLYTALTHERIPFELRRYLIL